MYSWYRGFLLLLWLRSEMKYIIILSHCGNEYDLFETVFFPLQIFMHVNCMMRSIWYDWMEIFH